MKRKKELETQKIPTEGPSTREERQRGRKKIYYVNNKGGSIFQNLKLQ